VIVPRQPVIYVAKTAVDLRCGFDKLALFVTEHFGKSPRDGALFVFLNKAKNRLKILLFDASGAWVLHKRLDRGVFPLPTSLDPHVTHIGVSAEELTLLLQGLDTGRARRVRPTPPLH
jgi:transposase